MEARLPGFGAEVLESKISKLLGSVLDPKISKLLGGPDITCELRTVHKEWLAENIMNQMDNACKREQWGGEPGDPCLYQWDVYSPCICQ